MKTKELKDWKTECESMLESYIKDFAFKGSSLYNVSFTTFRMDGKTTYWVDVIKDSEYHEFMFNTWEEAYNFLFPLLQGMIISEGGFIKRRELNKVTIEEVIK